MIFVSTVNSFSICNAVVSSRFLLRDMTTMLIPKLANCFAYARPIPSVAPVATAQLPNFLKSTPLPNAGPKNVSQKNVNRQNANQRVIMGKCDPHKTNGIESSYRTDVEGSEENKDYSKGPLSEWIKSTY
jgi:hypothetical protein